MELIESDLFVYCSDIFLLKKIQKLVFAKDDKGNLDFSFNHLLPLPTSFTGIPDYQIFGYHWRTLMWGTKHDGRQYSQNIRDNSFDVHFTTPGEPAHIWFETFCKLAAGLHGDCDLFPYPELIIFLAYGIPDTSNQGFVHWEPRKDIEHVKAIPDESRARLIQFFDKEKIKRYGDIWE